MEVIYCEPAERLMADVECACGKHSLVIPESKGTREEFERSTHQALMDHGWYQDSENKWFCPVCSARKFVRSAMWDMSRVLAPLTASEVNQVNADVEEDIFCDCDKLTKRIEALEKGFSVMSECVDNGHLELKQRQLQVERDYSYLGIQQDTLKGWIKQMETKISKTENEIENLTAMVAMEESLNVLAGRFNNLEEKVNAK